MLIGSPTTTTCGSWFVAGLSPESVDCSATTSGPASSYLTGDVSRASTPAASSPVAVQPAVGDDIELVDGDDQGRDAPEFRTGGRGHRPRVPGRGGERGVSTST